MIRYLVDTDTCIYALKRQPQVLARMDTIPAGEAGMSIVSYAELCFGAWKSQRTEQNLEAARRLSLVIPIQELDQRVAGHYGRIRAGLEKAGNPIGPYDLLIAAHALALGVVLVTNNVDEFSGVPGLTIENWAG